MAVDLSKLVSKRRIAFEELSNTVIAIDAYNVLYQFLSIIRQPDGTPLTDSKGNVTSHLSGIFYRTIELVGYNIKPIYVFDGLPSMLKQKTIEARMQRRNAAYEAWQEAVRRGDIQAAKTHAQASARVDKHIVESSKALLDRMGIAYINAPSEGEAQASGMCRDGIAYAVASQDYDTMLFGAPHVVRNLTFSGRRKLPKKDVYINVEPEMVDFDETLRSLGINHKQLIWLGIMLGTDYNEGIKGVGPKTALKIAKASESIDDIKGQIKDKFKAEFEIDIKEVEELFTKPEVKELGKDEVERLLEKKSSRSELIKFMCEEHGFSHERIDKFADKLEGQQEAQRQQGMDKWLRG
jgi:flap endonuclease-1